MALLHTRYQTGDVVEIPDRDKGDLGLEAFTRDGRGYQCYAAEEPLSVDDLYRKQRDKITGDIAKQERHSAKLVAMLGSLRLSHWILMVPRHESRRLLDHAEAKSEEYRRKRLPQLSADFTITIVTELNYPEECNRLDRSAVEGIDIRPDGDLDTAALHETEPELIQTMRSKLERLPELGQDSDRLDEAMQALMHMYLKYISVEAVLRDTYPGMSQRLDRLIVGAEERLAIAGDRTNEVGVQGVADLSQDLAQRIHYGLNALSVSTTEDVAYGVVADWLMRCPLRINLALVS